MANLGGVEGAPHYYYYDYYYLPSVVKIPRVKSSKKLKSKAGVAMHLNRPAGTPGQHIILLYYRLLL